MKIMFAICFIFAGNLFSSVQHDSLSCKDFVKLPSTHLMDFRPFNSQEWSNQQRMMIEENRKEAVTLAESIDLSEFQNCLFSPEIDNDFKNLVDKLRIIPTSLQGKGLVPQFAYKKTLGSRILNRLDTNSDIFKSGVIYYFTENPFRSYGSKFPDSIFSRLKVEGNKPIHVKKAINNYWLYLYKWLKENGLYIDMQGEILEELRKCGFIIKSKELLK